MISEIVFLNLLLHLDFYFMTINMKRRPHFWTSFLSDKFQLMKRKNWIAPQNNFWSEDVSDILILKEDNNFAGSVKNCFIHDKYQF